MPDKFATIVQLAPFAENCRAYPYHGRTRLYGLFNVPAHSHAQLLEIRAPRTLGSQLQKESMQAVEFLFHLGLEFDVGGHSHQITDAQIWPMHKYQWVCRHRLLQVHPAI